MPEISFFTPRDMGERAWGTETLIAETPHYTGKILFYKKGHAGGFQYHVEKHESFHLVSGGAYVSWVSSNGDVQIRRLMVGETVVVPPGAPHRFYAIEDCTVFEVSTPHYNDRVNVAREHGYDEPPDTLPSTWERLPNGDHVHVATGRRVDGQSHWPEWMS